METPPPAPTPSPEANPTPANRPSSDDKLWIIACHASILLGIGLIVPLVIYLVKKDENAQITEHAKEALNFHISVFIYATACVITFFLVLPMFLLFAIGIAAFVLGIIASIKSADGILYRYQLTIRLVK